MTTLISDLAFVPELFADYVQADIRKKSDYFQSGAVVDSPVLVPSAGSTIAVPAWDGLGGDADVMGDTAPSTNALDSSVQVAAILQRNKKYGASDLASSFAGSNPLDALGSKIGSFWQRSMDLALLNATKGSAAGLDALEAGSIIRNISAVAGTGALINAQELIATRALGGEYMNDYNLLVVHPQVYAKLQADEVTELVPGANGMPMVTFQGMRLVINSNLSATGGVFDSLLVRAGAFGYADGTKPEHVLEMDREIGFGDVFATQRRYVIHPFGAKFNGVTAGATATNAELANAGKWTLGSDSIDVYGVRILKSRIAVD